MEVSVNVGTHVKITANNYAVALTKAEAIQLRDWLNREFPPRPKRVQVKK